MVSDVVVGPLGIIVRLERQVPDVVVSIVAREDLRQRLVPLENGSDLLGRRRAVNLPEDDDAPLVARPHPHLLVINLGVLKDKKHHVSQSVSHSKSLPGNVT